MNTLRLSAILLLSVFLLEGARAGEGDEPQRDAALYGAIRRARAVRDAERIVVAEVKEVHESPGIWCGTLVTHQDVTYRITEAIYGGAAEGEVRVGHLLVHGSPLVSQDAPFLKPSVFHPGARFLLCLHRDAEKWAVRDETFGAVPIDAPRIPDPIRTELLRVLLQHPEFETYLHPEREGRVPLKVALTDAMPVAPDLTVLGHRVEFVPPYLLRGAPHVALTAIEVDDGRAQVRFTYDVEGVVGEALFTRDGDHYRLDALQLSER